MSKLFKRVMTGVLTASIAFSSATLMAFQSSALTAFKAYQTNYQTASAISARKEIGTDKILAWVNGGKAKYEIADLGITVDVDGKTASISLAANSDGTDIVDITSSKSVVWGVVASDGSAIATGVGSDGIPTGGFDMDSKPLSSLKTSDGKEIFKVSAGKVTAGKVAGTGTIGIYKAIKSSSTTTYYLLAKFPVEIKLAPASISTFAQSDGIVWTTGTTKSKPTNTLTVGLNATTDPLYIVPKDAASAKDSSGIDLSSTYTVKVDEKSLGYVKLNAGTTGTDAADSITLSDAEGYAFTVTGTSLASKEANGKTTYSNPKAGITITNNQSGKSCKVSVTVTNGVSAVLAATSDGNINGSLKTILTTYKAYSSAATFDVTSYGLDTDGTPKTVDSGGVKLITVNSDGFDITVKPTVGVFTTKDDSVPTLSDVVDGGKIKFNATGTSTTLTKGDTAIKIDKDNKTVTLTPKKADYATDKLEYAIIAYGTSASQILIIPLTLSSPLIATTIEIPVKGLVDSSGVQNWGSDGVVLTLSTDTSATKIIPTSIELAAYTAKDGEATATVKIIANLLPGTKYKVSIVTTTSSTNKYKSPGNPIEITTGKNKTGTTEVIGTAKLPSSITSSKPWALTINT